MKNVNSFIENMKFVAVLFTVCWKKEFQALLCTFLMVSGRLIKKVWNLRLKIKLKMYCAKKCKTELIYLFIH